MTALVIWNGFFLANVPAFKNWNTQSKWSQITKQQANLIKKKKKKSNCSVIFFFFSLFGVLRKPPSHHVWYWSSNSVLHSCCRWVVKNCESTDFTGSDPLRGRFEKTQVSFWAIKKKQKKSVQEADATYNLFFLFSSSCDFLQILKKKAKTSRFLCGQSDEPVRLRLMHSSSPAVL